MKDIKPQNQESQGNPSRINRKAHIHNHIHIIFKFSNRFKKRQNEHLASGQRENEHKKYR